MNLLILIAGLGLVVLGAHFLVEGSVSVAKRYHMPEFLIGITIVGIGTSLPELVVSLFGTIAGKGDVAIGNVLGSNLANTLLILGASALITPIAVSKNNLRADIPYNVLTAIVLLITCFGFAFWRRPEQGIISRPEGIILLVMFVSYMIYSFRYDKTPLPEEEQRTEEKPRKIWLAIVMILCGLAGLILGGNLFVGGATKIAIALGISESVIAITILAVGTSLPELATSLVAAAKGNTQLALGNIIGSNIANITLILGVCATIRPLGTGSITALDMYMPLVAAIMLLLAALIIRKRVITRGEGVIFLMVYISYIVFLVVR